MNANDQQTGEIHQLKAANETLKAENETLKAANETLETANEALTTRTKTLIEKKKALIEKKKALKADKRALKKDMKALQTQTQNNKALEEENTKALVEENNKIHQELTQLKNTNNGVNWTRKEDAFEAILPMKDLTRSEQSAVFRMMVTMCMGGESKVTGIKGTQIDSVNPMVLYGAFHALQTRQSLKGTSYPMELTTDPKELGFTKVSDDTLEASKVSHHMVYAKTDKGWRKGYIWFAVEEKFEVNMETGIDIKKDTAGGTLLQRSEYVLVAFAKGDFGVRHITTLWKNDRA
jgi:FtsZ-binding cell division protein ZapB